MELNEKKPRNFSSSSKHISKVKIFQIILIWACLMHIFRMAFLLAVPYCMIEHLDLPSNALIKHFYVLSPGKLLGLVIFSVAGQISFTAAFVSQWAAWRGSLVATYKTQTFFLLCLVNVIQHACISFCLYDDLMANLKQNLRGNTFS